MRHPNLAQAPSTGPSVSHVLNFRKFVAQNRRRAAQGGMSFSSGSKEVWGLWVRAPWVLGDSLAWEGAYRGQPSLGDNLR
jgi:hypothetical protein